MGKMIVGGVLCAFAVLLLFNGTGLFATIIFIVGLVQLFKGYNVYSAARLEDQRERDRFEEQRRKEFEAEQRAERERNEALRQRKESERQIQETRQQIAVNAGKQNLRRLVSELVDYSNSIEPNGADNKSTLNAMHDTISRIEAQDDITETHKSDSNIQFDVKGIIKHLQECGLGNDRVIARMHRFLLRDEPEV